MDGKDTSHELGKTTLETSRPEDILAQMKESGFELSDAELDQVTGGSFWDPPNAYADGCPKCGSHDLHYGNVGQTMWYTCKNCGHKWA